jgi:hypothetical protein
LRSGLQLLPVSWDHPAPLQFPGHSVQVLECQLPTMHVERAYDVRKGTSPSSCKDLGKGTCSLSPHVVDAATTEAGEVPPHMASLGRLVP